MGTNFLYKGGGTIANFAYIRHTLSLKQSLFWAEPIKPLAGLLFEGIGRVFRLRHSHHEQFNLGDNGDGSASFAL
jgi:hypothetical protein